MKGYVYSSDERGAVYTSAVLCSAQRAVLKIISENLEFFPHSHRICSKCACTDWPRVEHATLLRNLSLFAIKIPRYDELGEKQSNALQHK